MQTFGLHRYWGAVLPGMVGESRMSLLPHIIPFRKYSDFLPNFFSAYMPFYRFYILFTVAAPRRRDICPETRYSNRRGQTGGGGAPDKVRPRLQTFSCHLGLFLLPGKFHSLGTFCFPANLMPMGCKALISAP